MRKVLGSIVGWGFTCIENAEAVAWVDSVAYHLYTHLTFGDKITLTLEFADGRHSVPAGTTVWLRSITVYYSSGMKTRYFDVTVAQVPS